MMLGNHPLVISRQFDHTQDLGQRFFRYRRISLLNKPESFCYRINAANLGPLGFAYAEYQSDLDFDVGEHDDAYFAVFRWRGHDDIRVGCHQFDMPANSFAFLPPRQSIRVVSRAGARGMAIRFKRESLERELARLLNLDDDEGIPYCPALTLSGGFARTFDRMARYLVSEIDRDDSHLIRNEAASLHAANALTAMLLEGHPALTSRLAGNGNSTSDYKVRRVEDYLRANLDQALTMGDLAAIAGVSASTLHEQFRRHRNCAPMQFVRKLRLEAVRRDLMSGMPFPTVTEVAYRWGFVHLGRFADHYRRMYGESPSTTLRRHHP